MKRLIPYVAAIALAAAAAGCNKGVGNSAYNNSGASATPGSTATSTTPTYSDAPSTTAGSNMGSTNTASTAPTDTSTSSTTGSANAVTDTVTSGKVMAAFTADPNLKDSDIAVKTEGGIVTLSGTAKSQDQVAMATSIAQRQEGVSRVDSQVVVR